MLLIVVGCGSTPKVEPPAELVKFNPAFYVKKLWSKSLPIRDNRLDVQLRPLITDGTVYVASDRGAIAAFSAAKGKKLWRVDIKADIAGGLGETGRLLLLGTRKAEVFAIAREDGAIVWHSKVSSEVLAPPVEAGGIVIVRTVDGKISGLSATSGEQIWVAEQSVPSLTLRGLGLPVVWQRRVIAGTADGKVVALSLANGETVWEKSIAIPEGRSELDRLVDVDGDLLVVDDTVYVAAYHGSAAALNVETGRVLWQRDISSDTGVTSDEHNLYITDDKSRVWALDRRSGETLWMQDALHLRSVTRPTVHGDYIVVGDYEGYLHWLAKGDGHFVAREEIDDKGISVPPVAVNDVLYVAGRDGTITAVKLLPVRPLPRSFRKGRHK